MCNLFQSDSNTARKSVENATKLAFDFSNLNKISPKKCKK